MRRDFINKIIATTIISTTLCTLVTVRASAEWKSDYQNNWYYMQDGKKLTGWKKIEGKLYYFDSYGKMQTGWLKVDNSYYFLENDGVLKIGWFKYDRNWYYSDSNGVIQTGTINIAGKVYIFDNNGIMKTNNTLINGEFYTIGADGAVAGAKVPTPDKEFDDSGKLLQVLKNTDSNSSASPTYSSYSDVIKDQSVSDGDPNEGRTFEVRFKDSNGAELKSKSIKNGKNVDLFAPTKDGFVFGSWNTKSDGSGKSYASSDNFKVKENINLYAQWTTDNAVYVDGITIKGSSYVTVNKTTQMTAEVTPTDAANKGVTWSVTDGTGKASIDSNGVLTGATAGTVTVKATAQDKSQYSVTKEITVSTVDVTVPVTKISIGSKTGAFGITTNGGTLQMTAKAYPSNADNQNIKWSVDNIGGSASIDENTGLVTAISNGVVTVKATAQDGSGVVGSTTITISGQTKKIPVDSIQISAKGGVNQITTDAALGEPSGTLQMNANISPATASNKAIVWSIINGKDYADISSSTGLITAKANGTITVQATVVETGMVSNKVDIGISGQSIKVTGIEIIHSGTALDNAAPISGDTDFSITTTPASAAYKEVKWVVENKTGSAEFNGGVDTGATVKLTPDSNGDVLVKAIATAIDGTTVSDTQLVNIQGVNKPINVTRIDKVYGVDDTGKTVSYISKDDGTLTMHADIFPTYANTTGAAVTWKVIGGGPATITGTNTLQAIGDTTKAGSVPVVVRATCTGASGTITKDVTINISNQFTQATGVTITPNATPKVAVGGTLQMSAKVANADATYQNVVWGIETGGTETGTAYIDKTTGLLTGGSKGFVNVVATADNNIGTPKQATQRVEVTEPIIATGITVTPTSGNITTIGGKLPIDVTLNRTDATNQGINWSIVQDGSGDAKYTGSAVFDNGTTTATTTGTNGTTGVTLKALTNGDVKVVATYAADSKIIGASIINISGQPVKATGLLITDSAGGTTNVITDQNGTLELIAGVMPTNATTTPASVTWSVEPTTTGPQKLAGSAEIIAPINTPWGTSAKVKALKTGDVIVKATGKATDGTDVTSPGYVISLSGQIIKATGITINKPSTSLTIGKAETLTVTLTPPDATTKTVEWSVVGDTGAAIIGNHDGSIMGTKSGAVNVTANVKDDTTGAVIATATTPVYIA